VKWRKLSTELLTDNRELLTLSVTVVVSIILTFSASQSCVVVSAAKSLLSVTHVQSLHLCLVPSVALLLFFLDHEAM
jgi:hypothetical protein